MLSRLIMIIIVFLFLHISILTSDLLAQTSQSWQVPVHVVIDSFYIDLNFGVDEMATEDFDYGIDAMYPPPPTQPYAFFWIAGFPNILQTDLHSPDSSVIWNLHIINSEDRNIRISWEASRLNLPGTLLFNDSVNMLHQKYIDLVGNQQLKITYQANTVNVENVTERVVPNSFYIQNYPNPFTTSTTFELNVPNHFSANVRIFNVVGQEIRTFNTISKTANLSIIQWDGTDKYGFTVPAGIYFCRMESSTFVRTLKIFRSQQ